jgi:hypothetical protein
MDDKKRREVEFDAQILGITVGMLGRGIEGSLEGR